MKRVRAWIKRFRRFNVNKKQFSVDQKNIVVTDNNFNRTWTTCKIIKHSEEKEPSVVLAIRHCIEKTFLNTKLISPEEYKYISDMLIDYFAKRGKK